MFYATANSEKRKVAESKDIINKQRQKSKLFFCCNSRDFSEMSLGMGTSEQIDVGSSSIKRFSSLFSKGQPEKVVAVSDGWKTKGGVADSRIKKFNTHERLFVAANNVDRQPEDGCMKKIKIERSLKLRQEDFKNRPKYDIVSGVASPDSAWVDSFGKQALDAGVKTTKT